MAKNSQIRDSTAIQYVAGAESFFVLVVLSRVALWAAILSNVDKARWAFAQLSETDAWSPTLIAIALELALAVTAYGLAEARRRQQPTLALKCFRPGQDVVAGRLLSGMRKNGRSVLLA